MYDSALKSTGTGSHCGEVGPTENPDPRPEPAEHGADSDPRAEPIGHAAGDNVENYGGDDDYDVFGHGGGLDATQEDVGAAA